MVSGVDGQRGVAEFELRAPFSMESKKVGNLMENKRFRMSMGPADQAQSQNLSLE